VHRSAATLVVLVAAFALCAPASLDAARLASPAAITGTVSSVSASSAIVNGTINPNGKSTSWNFEYGTSTSYGSRTAVKSAGSGTTNQGVSETLSGLKPRTAYHYRLVGTSSDGTTRGSDGVFTTTAAPAAVTGSASAVTATTATLTGSVDPNGRETSWYFEYGPGTNYGSRTSSRSAGAGRTVNISASVSGLTTGRTYHFRLVATSDAGTAQGADRTFSTGVGPAVATGPASRIAPTSATLNGTVDAHGQSTTFYFEYGPSTSYGSRTPDRGAGSHRGDRGVSAGISRLTAATTYHYRLVARNASGTTFGSDQSFSTSLAPAVATGSATATSATSATLTGVVDTHGRPTNWYFEYGPSATYGSRTGTRSAGSAAGNRAVSAAVTGLQPGVTYHFRLVARSDAGTANGSDRTFNTASPPHVTTGPPSSVGPTRATLTGTVDTSGLTSSWYFEYGTTTGYGVRTAPGTAVGSGPRTVTVTISALSEGTTFHYRLVATNAAGTTAGADASFATQRQPARCTIVGTSGNDVLAGTAGRDVICGLGGNDRIVAGAGNDLVYGGPGDDVIRAGTGRDLLDGGPGRDRLYAGPGDDVVQGRAGNDVVLGGSGRDRLFGGLGADVFFARDGQRDLVSGGLGADRARVDPKRDRTLSATRF
jgi:Ca2+-binding RTX toxin-like protein